MEQTRAQAKVGELKRQLEMVDDAHLAKMYSEAKRDIEHHFDDLFNSILERKATLLKSLESSFALLKARMIGEQTQLKAKLEITTKTLEAGLSMLKINQKDAAYTVLQGIDFITHQQQEYNLQAILPDSLIPVISLHGSILLISSSIPATITIAMSSATVTTLAGSLEGCVDGVGEVAKFNKPAGVVLNPDDNCLYVCDNVNNMIRKVSLLGEVSVFCAVYSPYAITYNRQLKLFYVSSFAHTIHQISSAGIASLFAGVDGKFGDSDGMYQNAYFHYPTGLTVNQQTNDLYVSDYGNDAIRKITQEGVVSTLSGSKNRIMLSLGMKQKSQLNNPLDLIYHATEQTLIVCDWGNDCLKRITMDGIVPFKPHSFLQCYSGNVTTLHKVQKPRFITFLTDDIAYVSSETNRIFKFQLSDVNKVEVFAGTEERGYKDGPVLECLFSLPSGLAIDSATNTCYVAGDHKIRLLDVNGTV